VLWSLLLAVITLAGTGLGNVAYQREALASIGAAPSRVAAAQGWIILGLAAAGVVAAVAGAVLPSGLIGLAGLVPILRGLHYLTSVRFLPPLTDDGAAPPRFTLRALAAASGDCIVAYLVLAATRADTELAAVTAVLGVMAALGCFAARRLASRPASPGVDRLRGVGAAVSPWTLVALGVALLAEGGTFNWLWMPTR
jgi:cadmium resistance protein CadD (predicted permease)